MKSFFLLLLSLCVAAFPALADAPQTLADYHAGLNRSCVSDADCAVKDVGNCCGYFPACLNKEATPDKALVQAECAKQDMMSVCGFQDISACSCIDGTCQPAGGNGSPGAPVAQ